jgi:hypothetical protein
LASKSFALTDAAFHMDERMQGSLTFDGDGDGGY